jgi:protein-serine/threonine kinase
MPEPARPRLASIPSEREVNKASPRPADSASIDDDFGDRILLTPPAQFTKPLDSLAFSYFPPTSTAESQQTQNAMAFFKNMHHQATHSHGHDASSIFNGLHIQTTDLPRPHRSASTHSMDSEGRLRSSASAASLPRRIPSIRSHLHSTAGSLSPGSVISSPQIAAMLDITPLPSPTMGAFETFKTVIRSRSRASSTSSRPDLGPAAFPPSSPSKKGYHSLRNTPSKKFTSEDMFMSPEESRARTRSLSDYVPDALAIPKPRHVAVSGSGPPQEASQSTSALQREEYLGVQRGLAEPVSQSPPFASVGIEPSHEDEPASKRPKLEVFTASSISSSQIRKYESLRLLGQGTFSKVFLAVRQVHDRSDTVDYSKESVNLAGVRARSRRLVAVKVVEPGPAGGADAERVQVSLKREVDLLKSIKHPSLVHLKAFGNDASARALLVINYCPGGDLFDVANTRLDVLTPPLVRRIFSELVSAVRYLHQKYIVHRDIKLESRSAFISMSLS